jgi:predicted molibdopterin-dependent oxidoreductase YjgC
MGAPGFSLRTPREVFEEIGRAVPAYAGISHARLLEDGVPTLKPSNDNPQPTQVMYSDVVLPGIQWPCSSGEDGGTPVLFANGFPNGKAKLGELTWLTRPGPEDDEFPMMLAHGRVLAQSARPGGIVTEDGRNRIERREELVLNPEDASGLDLKDGQQAVAQTADGRSIEGIVRISAETNQGVVSLTTLFGELATSLDAADRPDPMNHIPRLNAVAVRVAAAEPEQP